MPVSIWRATRLPRSVSLVITDPPSPYGESFASVIASFSSLTREISAPERKTPDNRRSLSGMASLSTARPSFSTLPMALTFVQGLPYSESNAPPDRDERRLHVWTRSKERNASVVNVYLVDEECAAEARSIKTVEPARVSRGMTRRACRVRACWSTFANVSS